MSITLEPTLQAIDLDHNQFQIQFSLDMTPGENPLDVAVPGLGVLKQADVYSVDFAKVNTPARGNFPALRVFQIAIQVEAQAAGATTSGAIYLINLRTAQVLAILPPAPTSNGPSITFFNVPFFVRSNQAVAIYRAASVNCIARLSATALTFDAASFFDTMSNP
jgi:hypothetical protein